jgi:isovaleryl-CoA dehydrogenase
VSALPSRAELDAVAARFFDVGKRLVAPSVVARDRAASFDRALWRALADAGLFRLEGVARRGQALEALVRGSLDLGLAVTACAHFVAIAVVEQHGSDEQKRAWLPKLEDGTWLAGCANAEPGAGTDLMGLKSRAREREGGFALSSRKWSVTNVGACDFALVSARLEGAPAREAMNIFGVETAGARRWMRLRSDLTGLRTSPTGSLLAWRAPLPPHALVGGRGAGVKLFRLMFSEERVTTGFLYLGALKACLERGVRHAEQRRQFGQPIGKNQYVQEKLVRMRVAAELLEAQLWRTLERMAAGDDVHASLSVVKVHGIEAAIDAAQDLVRLLGSLGVSVDEPAERLLRDLLGLSILGGTVELHKIVIYDETVRALSPTTPR